MDRPFDSQYKRLFETMLDGAVVLDATTARIVLANKAAARIFGFASPEEMVGQNPLDYVPEEDQERVAQMMAESFERDREIPAKIRIITKDKRDVWVSASGALIEYEGRKATFTTMRDITSEKAKEAALKESENRYWNVIDNASESIFITQDWKIVFANRKGAEVAGLTQKDLIGLSFLDITHPDDRKDVADRYQRILDGKWSSTPILARGIDSKGKTIWAEIREMPCSWDGRPAVMSFIVDITERKQTEEALRASEERFRALIENATDAVAIVGPNGEILYESPSSRRISGYTTEEMVGHYVTEYIAPEDLGKVADLFTALKGHPGKAVPPLQVRFKHGDGSWHTAEMTVQNLIHVPGIGGAVVNYRDITDRLKMEQALRESEQHYRLLAENVSDVIWMTDLNLRPTYFSPSVTDLLGYTIEEAMASTMQKTLTPASRKVALNAFHSALANEKAHPGSASAAPTLELEFIRKDGSTVWTGTKVSFIRDSDGKAVAILGVSRNISDRKEAEKALKESEERFRALTEKATDGIAVVDSNGTLIYESPSCKRLTGYEPEEIVGKSLADFIDPNDLGWLAEAFESMKRQPGTPMESIHLRFKHRDGTWHVAECSGRNLLDDPKVKGVIVNYRDITERMRAEEERLRLSTAIEQAAEVVVVTDREGTIQYVNPAFTRITGYTSDEAIGQNPRVLKSGQHDQAFYKDLWDTITGGKTWKGHFINKKKDGSLYDEEATISPIRSASGQITNFVAVKRDITDRKKAEEELRKSEERFRNLADLLPQTVFETDEIGNLIFVNRQGFEAFGYSKEDLTKGLNGTQFVTPEDRERAAGNILKRLGGEELGTNEYTALRKDGSTFPISIYSNPIMHANKPVGLRGIIIDITDRKKAEEELQDSERKYRLLVENSNDLIFSLDTKGNFTYVSPAIERISGYRVDEVIGTSFVRFVAPEDLPGLMASFERTLGGTLEPYEFRAMLKDGTTRHVRTTSKLVLQDGQVVGVTGIMSDVTAYKKAEEALQASEERYRLLVEKATEGIVVIQDGIVRFANPKVLEISGYTAEEVLLKPSLEYVHHDDQQMVAEHYARSLRGEEAAQVYQCRLVDKAGNTVWVEISAVLFDWEGRPATLVLMSNITERRRAEEALKDSEAKYRRLFESTQTAMEVISGETGLVVLANEATARMFGFASPNDLVGIDSMQFLRPEDVGWVSSRMAQALADKAWQEIAELQVRTNDGRWLWISGTGVQTEYQGKPALLVSMIDVTRRKEAEQKLIESEEKYRTVVDNAAEGIAVLQDGVYKFVNRRRAEFLGYSVEELTARRFEDLIHPDDRQMVVENYAKRLKGEEPPHTYRFRVVHKEGTIRWMEINAVRFNWEGRPAVLAMLNDITERKRAEEALKESEDRYRALYEDNPSMYFTVDPTGTVLSVNEFGCEELGYTAQELVGQSVLKVFHDEDKAAAAQSVALCVENLGQVFHWELRKVHKAGNVMWVKETARAVRGTDGKTVVFIVCEDITERRRAQEALKESEERYRALYEDNPSMYFTVDPTGTVLSVNEFGCQELGYTAQELVGQSVLKVFHDEDKAAAARSVALCVGNPGQVFHWELRKVRKAGSVMWVKETARAVRGTDGKTVVFIVCEDITERKRAQEALKESEERYRLVAENVSDVIWVTDMNLMPLYISPSVTRMLGYTPEEAMSGSVVGKVTDASAELALKALQDALAREAEQPGTVRQPWPAQEAEVFRRDGSTVWAETALSFVRDPTGKPVAILGVLRDISERKKADEAIRKSEERFRGLVETSSDWVWEIDRNTRYTYVSPKVRDILGYEPQEIMGRTPFEFMHQREGRRVSKIVRSFATARLPFSLLENTCTHKDGHSVVLETSAVPILDSDGGFLGYRGIDRDITERKKVEQELQRSLKRLEKTMESTIEAITTTIETRDPYTTGHQMRVTDLARAIARVMELPPAQIEGIRVAGLLHDIGKIAIPTEILSKPGKLNEVEFAMIQTHAKVGYNILKKIEFPWPVARTVLQHHERWNGSGYPHGIRGEDILLEARILAVADVIEAMSSHRPYRPSIGADKALDEITKNSGILYDPAVAKACVTAFTQGGFKFASSIPGVAGESEGTSPNHPVHSPEDD